MTATLANARRSVRLDAAKLTAVYTRPMQTPPAIDPDRDPQPATNPSGPMLCTV
jgi:hypothetical protein